MNVYYAYALLQAQSVFGTKEITMFEKIKRSFHTSLRSHLTVTVLALNVALFIIFDWLLIMLAEMSFDSDLLSRVDAASVSNAAYVNTYIEAKTNPFTLISGNEMLNSYLIENKTTSEARRSPEYSEISKLFSILKAADKDITNIWIASDFYNIVTLDGGSIMDEGKYDISSQEWYSLVISNLSNKDYIWFSSPMKDFVNPDSEAKIITAVMPVMENDNIIGYAGINLSADAVISKLSSMNFEKASCVIILDEAGRRLFPETDSFNDIFYFNQYPVSEALRLNINNECRTFTLPDSSIEHYSQCCSCKASNWRIISLFDGRLMSYNTREFFVNTAIIMLCFNVLVIMCLANRIKTELAELPSISRKLEAIKGGNYHTRINSKMTNELGKFCDTVDVLAAEMQAKIDKIENDAYTDALTGLPNRHKLYDYIEDYILAAKDSETRFAVLFIDIDNFKWINDTLGHSCGDEFLIHFSKRVNNIVSTFGRLARFSGDEFIALIELDDDINRVDRIIRTLQSEFEKPINMTDIYMDKIYATFSVGISVYPDDAPNADLLLRNADISKNKAKERGKNRVAYFNQSQHAKLVSKSIISQRLNGALNRGELFLNYQPIIATSDSEIYGFEVLVRWNSEDLGNIPPMDFIHIAEETGLIVDIGTWIFESACRFHKKLCDTYKQPWVISINVSPIQLKQPNFISLIRRALEITEVDPACIQVEITESNLIDFIGSTKNAVIEEMCSLGISLALDDFGTGYSSLNYLKNLPVKCLKIDKSFVDEIYRNSKDSVITNSIIDLVHDLGIKTVAEGVETEGQFASLNRMKCDLIQGFLMSKPLSETETIEFIENYRTLFRPRAEQSNKL